MGSHIEDSAGMTVVLRGVNRSGSEYACIQGRGFFDGPADDASVRAMIGWRINAVRVPLNESCWLAAAGAPAPYSGEAYKAAIRDYVAVLQANKIVPILDLHWVAAGGMAATRLQPMPDAASAPAFWTDVATTFRDNDGVVFEPFNEPYPDNNRDSDAGWQCWRDGCTATLSGAAAGTTVPYDAVGMQALVDAIRSTGARQVILLGGVQFSNNLNRWLEFKPTDPVNNLAAAWHVYNFNACRDASCWDVAPAGVAAMVPVVVTEFGERTCAGAFVEPLMTWLDAHGSGYLAWTWDAYGACAPYVSRTMPGQPWPLIADYAGTPNPGFGQVVHDHMVSR